MREFLIGSGLIIVGFGCFMSYEVYRDDKTKQELVVLQHANDMAATQAIDSWTQEQLRLRGK